MTCTNVFNRSGILLATIDNKIVEIFVGSAYGEIYFDDECPTPGELLAVASCKNINSNQFVSERQTKEKMTAIKKAARDYRRFKLAFDENQAYKRQLEACLPKRPFKIA